MPARAADFWKVDAMPKRTAGRRPPMSRARVAFDMRLPLTGIGRAGRSRCEQSSECGRGTRTDEVYKWLECRPKTRPKTPGNVRDAVGNVRDFETVPHGAFRL